MNNRTPSSQSASGGKKPFAEYQAWRGLRQRIYLPGKYIIVFGLLPLLILASVVFIYFWQSTRYEPSVEIEHRANASGVVTAYYPLPELIVDLAPDRRGRVTFLKVSPAIAVVRGDSEAALRKIDAAKPIITERVTLFLRALRPADFQGTNQLNRIKHELTRRINLGAGDIVAQDVVLEQLVIQ